MSPCGAAWPIASGGATRWVMRGSPQVIVKPAALKRSMTQSLVSSGTACVIGDCYRHENARPSEGDVDNPIFLRETAGRIAEDRRPSLNLRGVPVLSDRCSRQHDGID
jgi:hypothetical protein